MICDEDSAFYWSYYRGWPSSVTVESCYCVVDIRVTLANGSDGGTSPGLVPAQALPLPQEVNGSDAADAARPACRDVLAGDWPGLYLYPASPKGEPAQVPDVRNHTAQHLPSFICAGGPSPLENTTADAVSWPMVDLALNAFDQGEAAFLWVRPHSMPCPVALTPATNVDCTLIHDPAYGHSPAVLLGNLEDWSALMSEVVAARREGDANVGTFLLWVAAWLVVVPLIRVACMCRRKKSFFVAEDSAAPLLNGPGYDRAGAGAAAEPVAGQVAWGLVQGRRRRYLKENVCPMPNRTFVFADRERDERLKCRVVALIVVVFLVAWILGGGFKAIIFAYIALYLLVSQARKSEDTAELVASLLGIPGPPGLGVAGQFYQDE